MSSYKIISNGIQFWNTILELLYPSKCLSCGAKSADLCLKCLLDTRQAERETEGWIFPIYDYRHPPLKKALWLLKYKGKKKLAIIFAEVLYGRMVEEIADLSIMANFSNPIIIPIPLSRKRRNERGYNQAELICKEIIRLDHYTNFNLETDILIKPKETIHQAHIENRKERLKNIIGSFGVHNETKIKDRNIILIDDITTTGATLSEAKKVLKKFGAKKVIAFTVAH